VRSLQEAHQNLQRTLNRQLSPDILTEGAAGDRARAEFAARMERSDVAREFDAPGMHFGYRYTSPVIIPDPPSTAEPPAEGRTVDDVPVDTVPGARAPHLWVSPGRSTLDLFGAGFTLMCLEPSSAPRTDPDRLRAWTDAWATRRVPLRVERFADAGLARGYQRRFVLVRPDGHVAWRGHALPPDPELIVDAVRGAHPVPDSAVPGRRIPEGSR
jgi:hypothetical protein